MKVWVWKDEYSSVYIQWSEPVIKWSCSADDRSFDDSYNNEGALAICQGGRIFKGLRRNGKARQYELTAKEVK